MELTDLQRRVLRSAAAHGGRIIYWVLGDGRQILPGFTEDVAGTLRALEGAGLLAAIGPDGNPAAPLATRAKGSHVMALTETARRHLEPA